MDNNMINKESLEERSNILYEQRMAEQNDYQSNITEYINRKHENNLKKEYNPKIIELYKNGLLVIDNIDYKLKDFFIVYDSEKNNFTIKCINPNYHNIEIDYNCAIRFIDSTAFINLIKSCTVIDNKVIVDINTLNNIVSNWDGYLHSETLETDSVINKKIIK